MTPRAIRRLVVCVCVIGIAGMIFSSITERAGAAVTFGLLTATAVVGLILVTSVAGAHAFDKGRPPIVFDEDRAAEVEAQVQALVDGGADESAVRNLVRTVLGVARSVDHR